MKEIISLKLKKYNVINHQIYLVINYMMYNKRIDF